MSSKLFRIIIVVAVAAICFLSIPATAVCSGPRTRGQLREHLWGSDSNYDSLCRPNVAVLESRQTDEAENPAPSVIASNTSIPSEAENPLFSSALIPSDAAPDIVRAQLHLLSIESVDITTGQYSLSLWFRTSWNDPRLAYRTASQGGCFPDNNRQGYSLDELDNIWSPDIAINNMIHKEQIAGSFWIYPNGDVVAAVSLILTLSCQMEFSQYPRDSQRCSVAVGTWLEDASEIVMQFSDPPVTLSYGDDFGSSFDLTNANEWELIEEEMEFDGTYYNQRFDSQGAAQAESVLVFTFLFKRHAGVYVDFIVTPILLIVALSWASFFIERKSAPARVSMSVICFLTNINYLSAAYGYTPPFADQVWILRFLSQSMFFTFYAVIEYVICDYMFRVEQRIKEGKRTAVEIKLKTMNDLAKEEMKRRLSVKLNMGALVTDQQLAMAQIDNEKQFISKRDFIASGYKYKIDLLLLGHDGKMHFRDEHVDIFSRYTFPVVYCICFAILWTSN